MSDPIQGSGGAVPTVEKELVFQDAGLISIPAGRLLANPVFLKKWRINQNGTVPAQDIRMIESFIGGATRKISGGAGSITWAFLVSNDDVTYTEFYAGNEPTIGALKKVLTSIGDQSLDETQLFVAFACYSSVAGIVGELSNMLFHTTIFLPDTFTLEDND